MAFNSNLAVVLAVSFVLSAVIIGDAAAPSPSPSQKSSIALPPSSSSSSPKAAPAPSKFFVDTTIDDIDDELDIASPPKPPVSPAEEQEITKFLVGTISAAADKMDYYFNNNITERIAARSDDDSIKKCLKLCREVYADGTNDIKNALNDVLAKNWPKATADTTKFANNIETCSDCFDEIEVVDIELEGFGKWAIGVANETLRKLKVF